MFFFCFFVIVAVVAVIFGIVCLFYFILFYYNFILFYIIFGLFVSWFPFMSLMCFIISLIVLVVFSSCC